MLQAFLLSVSVSILFGLGLSLALRPMLRRVFAGFQPPPLTASLLLMALALFAAGYALALAFFSTVECLLHARPFVAAMGDLVRSGSSPTLSGMMFLSTALCTPRQAR